MSVFLYCGGHHDSDRTAVLVWSPRLKLLYCKYHQFMYTLPNKDFLPSFLHGIPSYNHKASVRSTTLLPLGEWPILPLSQDLDPSPVRRICQLWIGVYPYIKAVALVTIHFMYYSKAASVEMFSTGLHYFWANSCFLAAMTLTCSAIRD